VGRGGDSIWKRRGALDSRDNYLTRIDWRKALGWYLLAAGVLTVLVALLTDGESDVTRLWQGAGGALLVVAGLISSLVL